MLGSTYFYSNSFLSIPSNSALALGSGSFTIEMWVYIRGTTIPTTAVLFDQRNGTSGASVLQPYINVNSTNGYTFISANKSMSTTTSYVSLNTWQHVAVVKYLGRVYMFVDGVYCGGGGDNQDIPTGSINIGKANDGVNTNYFNGYIADLRITKGEALYTNDFSGFTRPSSPLQVTSNTIFLMPGRVNGAYDIGPNNISITKNNDILFSDVTPYRSGWLGNGVVAEDFNAAVVDDRYKGTWSSTSIGPNYNRT